MSFVDQAGSPGTSSGRAQSAVILPVPEAEGLVGRWRAEHDPVANAGVPAHITLIVPWISLGELCRADLDQLDALLSSQKAFDYRLTDVRWFGRRVLWLAPDPVEPFQELTAVLAEHFGTPPWEDEFDEVVPHLTVAHASDGVELDSLVEGLKQGLPLECRASEVHVMCGDGQRWRVEHRAHFG